MCFTLRIVRHPISLLLSQQVNCLILTRTNIEHTLARCSADKASASHVGNSHSLLKAIFVHLWNSSSNCKPHSFLFLFFCNLLTSCQRLFQETKAFSAYDKRELHRIIPKEDEIKKRHFHLNCMHNSSSCATDRANTYYLATILPCLQNPLASEWLIGKVKERVHP